MSPIHPYDFKWNFRKVRTGAQFTCCRRDLTKWLFANFGQGSANKFIPAWLMGAPNHLIAAFLSGYLSADGHIAKTAGSDVVEATTVSRKLAYGLTHLAAATGHSPTVYRAEQRNDVIEGRKVNTLPVYTVKWRTELSLRHRQTFVADGVLWRPIRQVVELKNAMPVYNLSVEEDESYVAEGVIVHNCTHHSKARGGKPRDKRIRGLPWIIVREALLIRPGCIMFENVEEIQSWGPLLPNNTPDPARKGETFKGFLGIMTTGVPRDHPALLECCEALGLDPHGADAARLSAGLGYDFQGRELVAADYGAPTIRKRYYGVFRCDGRPIVWPEPTHNKGGTNGKQKWRSAAEVIDWSLPCPSISESKAQIKAKHGLTAVRPLADNTLKRIIKGVDKFTIRSGDPFIVPIGYGEREGQTPRVHDVNGPLGTVVGRDKFSVCQPVMSPFTATNTSNAVGTDAREPLNTVWYGNGAPLPLDAPLHTVTAKDREALTLASLCKFKGDNLGQHPDGPLQTVTASAGEFAAVKTSVARYAPGADLRYWPQVRALLNQHCGYTLSDDEVLLLCIGGVWYYIFDVGLRMLTPRELYNAMGFPPDYCIEFSVDGKPYSRSEQVARCGNAVCPDMSEALVRVNFPERCVGRITTMAQLTAAVAV